MQAIKKYQSLDCAPHFRHKVIHLAIAGLSFTLSPASFAADQIDTQPKVEDTAEKNTSTQSKDAQVSAEKPADEPPALEAFTVTTRNRKELAQSVPIPTSVVGNKELQRDNSVTALDFANKVPNLQIIQNQPRQSSFSIRGIGKNNSNEFTEGSVGVIFDDVYIANPGASFGNFYDINRVEVARGPQGTLLGKNTTLGVVNIVSNEPSFLASSKYQIGYGQRDTVRGNATSTGSLIDDVLAYRINFGYEKGDGPIKNDFKSNETLNDLNRVSARIKLLATPTEKLTARLTADLNKSSEFNGAWPINYGDPSTFANGTSRETYANRLATRFTGAKSKSITGSWDKYQANDMGQLESEAKGLAAKLEYSLDSGHLLTSITAARNYLFKAHNDYDILDTGFSGGYVRTNQFSQELRLTSPTGENFDYQTGIYYLNLKHKTGNTPGTVGGADSGALAATSAQYATLNADAVGRSLLRASKEGVFTDSQSNPEVDSLGFYGQINWHLTDKATLTTGLRRTWEERSNTTQNLVWGGTDLTTANFAGASNAQLNAARALRGTSTAYQEASRNNASWSWLVNPSYQLNENILFYASTAYGERSGTISFSNAGALQTTDPEKTTDYEIGVKSLSLDGRLRVNANLFFTDVRDYQVTLRQENPASPGTYINQFSNAERVTAKGLELDIEYALSNHWSLSASGALSPSRYNSWKNRVCPADVVVTNTTVCDNSGKRVAGSSDKSVTLTSYYQAQLNEKFKWHAFASNIYRSEYDASPNLTKEGSQDAFSIVNAGIGLTTNDGKYTLSLDARNLFDKIYFVSYSDYSNGTTGRAALGQRRFVGLNFRSNF